MNFFRLFTTVIFSVLLLTDVSYPGNQDSLDQQIQAIDAIVIQPNSDVDRNGFSELWKTVRNFVHEKKLFMSEFWHNRKQVGSLTPSSKYLAKAMTKDVKSSDRQTPLSILEVGAGTGIFTRYIIKRMPFDSEFDIVEIDPKFSSLLTKNISDEFGRDLRINFSKLNFCCSDITKFDSGKKYDFIISGLPFHSFDPELVRNILYKYVELLKPGGTIVFFEYIAIQTLKKPFISDEEQKTVEKIKGLINITKKLGKTKEVIVWRNILPARVISITID